MCVVVSKKKSVRQFGQKVSKRKRPCFGCFSGAVDEIDANQNGIGIRELVSLAVLIKRCTAGTQHAMLLDR